MLCKNTTTRKFLTYYFSIIGLFLAILLLPSSLLLNCFFSSSTLMKLCWSESLVHFQFLLSSSRIRPADDFNQYYFPTSTLHRYTTVFLNGFFSSSSYSRHLEYDRQATLTSTVFRHRHFIEIRLFFQRFF